MAIRKTATTRSAGKGRTEDTPATKSSYRGSAGMRRMQEEQERIEAQREARKAAVNEPFRFFVRPGETSDIIIIDEEPDFFRSEHALKNRSTGRWSTFTPCIDEHANCPVCAISDKPAYFAMYLTVIDLTPYENKDGDEIEWSKKLLVVKPAQQKKIARLYEKHGTLRGMQLSMTRDGDKDAAIGNDIEFVEFVDEEELLEYETEYTDKEGKVHEVIGHEPFDYESIYPELTEKQLKSIAGGGSAVGNRDDDNRSIGRRGRGREEEEEEIPRRRAPAGRRGRDEEEEEAPRSATRRGRPAPEPEEEEEEEVQERRPRASSRTAAKTTAKPASRRGRADEDEEEEEEIEEEAPRRTAKVSAKAAPKAASRRPQPAQEEEEEEEEPPFEPDRKRTSTAASRRDSIRNNRRG